MPFNKVEIKVDFGLKLGFPAIVLSVTTSVSIPTIDARRVTKLRESCGTCHELLLFQDLNVGAKYFSLIFSAMFKLIF